MSGVSCTAASSGHMVPPSCHHSTALSQACSRIHECYLHGQYFIKQILYLLLLSPSPDGLRSQGAALSWEHLTVQPRHQQLQCGDRVTELGAVTICRHMNTSSGVSPYQCAGSHTVAGQTCIWESCADIGCWLLASQSVGHSRSPSVVMSWLL